MSEDSDVLSADMVGIKRRELLAGLSAVGSLALAGCTNEDNAGEETSGSNNQDSTDTSAEAEYDPEDYYGLPECDGSRPIQLIAVNSDGTGIIQNMRGESKLVSVRHDENGFSDGDYCGDVIVGGGEQTAYEVSDYGEPNQIRIGAVDDSSRNRDESCNQGGGLYIDEYNHGCVDPNTFRGYQDVSSDTKDEEDEGPTTEVAKFVSALFTEGDEKPTAEDEAVSENDPVYVYVEATISDSRTPGEDGNKVEKASFSIQSPTGSYNETVEVWVRSGYTTVLYHVFIIEDWKHNEAEELYSESDIVVEYEGDTSTAEDMTGEIDVNISESDSEPEETETPEEPIGFSSVDAFLKKHLVGTPWVEINAQISNELEDDMEISYTYVVEGPGKSFEHEETVNVPYHGESVSYTFQISEWEDVEGDSRQERQEKREELFGNSTVYIEYDGQRFEAEKSIP